MRPHVLLAAGLLLGGCTSTAQTPAASPHATAREIPPAAGRVSAGGCGGTPVIRGGPPVWNPRPAGFTQQPPTLPYVLTRDGTAMGYLFRTPLTAPASDDGANKILWFVRTPRNGSTLRLTGHPLGADAPRVELRFPANSHPGEIYPSSVDVPRPGCWVFTLTWDGHEDTVALAFSPAPHSNSS